MIIKTTQDGSILILEHDQTGIRLMLEYDIPLEKYQLALVSASTVEPLNPVERRAGESNEVLYDRACAMAYRIMLNTISEKIEQQSRFDRMHYLFGLIKDKAAHIDSLIAHWDNDEPTEEDLGFIRNALSHVTGADGLLGEAS